MLQVFETGAEHGELALRFRERRNFTLQRLDFFGDKLNLLELSGAHKVRLLGRHSLNLHLERFDFVHDDFNFLQLRRRDEVCLSLLQRCDRLLDALQVRCAEGVRLLLLEFRLLFVQSGDGCFECRDVLLRDVQRLLSRQEASPFLRHLERLELGFDNLNGGIRGERLLHPVDSLDAVQEAINTFLRLRHLEIHLRFKRREV